MRKTPVERRGRRRGRGTGGDDAGLDARVRSDRGERRARVLDGCEEAGRIDGFRRDASDRTRGEPQPALDLHHPGPHLKCLHVHVHGRAVFEQGRFGRRIVCPRGLAQEGDVRNEGLDRAVHVGERRPLDALGRRRGRRRRRRLCGLRRLGPRRVRRRRGRGLAGLGLLAERHVDRRALGPGEELDDGVEPSAPVPLGVRRGRARDARGEREHARGAHASAHRPPPASSRRGA